MFVLNPLPPQVDPALIDLLAGAEPATIGHTLESGFVDPEIRALLPDRRIAGTAVTVRVSGPDTAIVHYALGQLRPGDVLVIDRAGDRRHACCGGLLAFAARAAGCRGIVIDGLATDIAELRAHGVPVWARGLSVITTKPLFLNGEFCTPVVCGGVAVMPGDAILADDNGVLVLPPARVEAAARRAIAMQEEEKLSLARIAAGEKLPAINGTDRRLREIVARQTMTG
jgi:4-hydroxy-4-methyl-2-oxoglutarate aldolase